MPALRPALRGALALRGRVLRRRFGSPLELVAVVVACAIAWRAGGRFGAEAARWLDPALLALVLVGGTAAWRLLYASRELTLLVPAGLSARELVALRGVELTLGVGAGLLPVLAFAAGAAGGGATPLVAAAPLVAVGLTAAALVGAALAGRLPAWGRAAAALGGGAVLVGLLVRPTAPSPLAAALLELGGGALAPLGPLAGIALIGCAAALLIAPRGHEGGLTRAALRDPRHRAPVWRVLAGALGALLGRDAGALLARDLALLARGALPRGVVVVIALPVLALLVTLSARSDRTMAPWLLELVALLVTGVAAAGAGFLFGVDIPRARRVQLVLERTAPLTGATVARGRVAGAVLAGAPALIAVVVALALDPDPDRAALAPLVLGEGLLVLACVAHDAVGYGLRGECSGDPAVASGYPIRAAPLVVTMAVGLTLHPLLGALYLLLGWHGEAARSARRWETEEVQPDRAQAA